MPGARILLNSDMLELWPATLLKARDTAGKRCLSTSRWLLRRKADGRYLAGIDATGRIAWLQRETLDPRPLTRLLQRARSIPLPPPRPLPCPSLRRQWSSLGLDAGRYMQCTGLTLMPEPDWLAFAGFDRYRRALWLLPAAARDWQRMCHAAAADGIVLEAISGYRSHAYQLGIVRRKLARGLDLRQILAVNAAPGFSEHHSGRALDISTPNAPAAEESFEKTPAFAWLCRHAAHFGFAMSYPRDNPHGIIYEPWHWCHQAAMPPSFHPFSPAP